MSSVSRGVPGPLPYGSTRRSGVRSPRSHVGIVLTIAAPVAQQFTQSPSLVNAAFVPFGLSALTLTTGNEPARRGRRHLPDDAGDEGAGADVRVEIVDQPAAADRLLPVVLDHLDRCRTGGLTVYQILADRLLQSDVHGDEVAGLPRAGRRADAE